MLFLLDAVPGDLGVLLGLFEIGEARRQCLAFLVEPAKAAG